MGSLYDTDIVLWSEQQAEKLRRLARGEQPNDLDWENVIEEVESVGRGELNTVRSLLRRALEHFLKAAAWPEAVSARRWIHDAGVFLRDARDAWAPSMIQRIDLAAVYQDAREAVEDLDFVEGPPGPLPDTCPVTLAELIAARHPADLAARFRPPA